MKRKERRQKGKKKEKKKEMPRIRMRNVILESLLF